MPVRAMEKWYKYRVHIVDRALVYVIVSRTENWSDSHTEWIRTHLSMPQGGPN